MKPPSQRSTNFMWTLNNYTDEEVALLQAIDCKYMTWGFEVGTENKVPHLQGSTIFNSKKTVKQVIDILPIRVSNIQIISKLFDAIKYCHKDENIYEAGTPPLTPEACGLKEIARHRDINSLAKQGNLNGIEEKYPDVWRRDYCKLKLIAKDHMLPPDALTELSNEWIHGPTGGNKSRDAYEEYPTAYRKSANNVWWDGYDKNIHDVVIIDDFDKYHVKQGYQLKIWADHYPFIAESKGGATYIRPKKIIVTSNYSIDDIWDDEQTAGPLKRRFKQKYKSPTLYLEKYDLTLPNCSYSSNFNPPNKNK